MIPKCISNWYGLQLDHSVLPAFKGDRTKVWLLELMSVCQLWLKLLPELRLSLACFLGQKWWSKAMCLHENRKAFILPLPDQTPVCRAASHSPLRICLAAFSGRLTVQCEAGTSLTLRSAQGKGQHDYFCIEAWALKQRVWKTSK